MRSRALSLWLFLLIIFAIQAVVFTLAAGLAEYSRRSLYIKFTAETAVLREVKNLPYAELINMAGSQYNVSPELIAAVIKAESSFEPKALSKAGAHGLMQVMPGTWQMVNRQALICNGRHKGECGSDCFYNPELNINIGACYLSQLLRRYESSRELAVAAYNAGPGAVDKYGGIPPYEETAQYVERVVEYWYQISGCLPPGGLSAASWDMVVVVVRCSWLITGITLLFIGRYLFRRHRTFRWR